MACTTCQNTKKIPVCITSLILGVSTPSVDVYVFIRNLTTGYTHRQEATTTEDGTIVLNLTQPDSSFYNPYSLYEAWVTLTTGTITDRLTVIIGETGYTCFALEFEKIFGDGGYIEHILEIE